MLRFGPTFSRSWRSADLNTAGRRAFSARPPEHRRSSLDKGMAEGTEIEGFKVTKVAAIPEFNMTAIRLRHEKTGADYLHLARDDGNNVFGVAFRTTPMDSTGLPHILEHVTLCGSQRFPCRDPFFKMLNRSMATFMNAMTGPDYTVYPFSTQNRTDFANLQSVYLDAVFNPLLRENDFRQEGWRLEHEKVDDKTSPIIIKGVVYSEMKGVFSDSHNIFLEGLMNHIMPSHTYGVVSGGDPRHIPDLTYAGLKNFHRNYYHPSNSRMYSYGNFPLADNLSFVNKQYLSDYADTNDYSKLSVVPPEPRWTSERRRHLICRPDPLSVNPKKQSSIAISNLCADIRDSQEVFTLQVLSDLMVRGPNSPFYKALVESNLGSGFSPGTGFDAQTRDTVFSVGLQGVNPSDFDKVEEIYYKTVNKIIDEGFDPTDLEAILHNIELAKKHQSSDFGLRMLLGLTPFWNHDGDVFKALRINRKVDVLKRLISDNRLFLQDCVQEYLKNNNHRLVLTMSPDDNYEKETAANEISLLNRKLNELSPAQQDQLYSKGLELAQDQEAKQDVSCLPTLFVSDLNPDVQRTKAKGELIGGVPVQIVSAPTNGVSYLRGVFNVSMLSEDIMSLLPLFCEIVPRMGTSSHDYRQFDQLTKLRTGGLSLGPHIAENIHDVNSYEEGVVFTSNCLDKNFSEMVRLWRELFIEVDLENEKRFRTLINEMSANIINIITDSGHAYAMSHAASFVSPSAKRKDQFAGLTYLQTLKNVSEKSFLTDTLEMLQNIKSIVFHKKFIRTSVNAQPETIDELKGWLDNIFDAIKGKVDAPFFLSNVPPATYQSQSVHYVLPFQVSHSAMCVPTVEFTNPDFPALRVLAKLLTSKYLLGRVREKGGAYGAGAGISTAGVFKMFSYRDPNPCDTYDIFNSARSWVLESNFTEQDVDEAKLGVFQSIDAPIPPGTQGARHFLYGIDDDQIQRHRSIIKDLKKDDLLKVSSYLESNTVGRCLLGPANNKIQTRTPEKWVVKHVD